MKEVVAFAPGHITGFFEIYDYPMNPLYKGSRGSGVSITKGVTTRVRIERHPKSSIRFRINNKLGSAKVSRYVVNTFLSLMNDDYRIFVDHSANIPIGSGLGSSGAGALSLALALNGIFNLKLSRTEAAQIAHVAEIECKTGLGTVIAETVGGLEIRVRPGAPGIGKIMQIPTDDNYVVVYLNFGPLPTNKMLSNEELRERANKFGGKLIEELVRQPTVNNFMTFSRSFAEQLGLISDQIADILKRTDKGGFTCSMPMFGESIFSVVKRNRLKSLLGILTAFVPSEQNIIVSDIDFQGARLI